MLMHIYIYTHIYISIQKYTLEVCIKFHVTLFTDSEQRAHCQIDVDILPFPYLWLKEKEKSGYTNKTLG